MIFYAKRNEGGKISYRWFADGELQREFEERYQNGENTVDLNDDTSQPIPEGSHEVYLEESGELLAIVRFEVKGQ